MKNSKILFYPGEKWVVIRGRRSAQGEKYAVSNHGRLVKFDETIKKGSLLKGSLQEGYPIWRYRDHGKHKHVLIHKLVAKYFLPIPNASQKVVTHLNFKKTDNHYKNLKWTSFAQAASLHQKNPAVIKARKKALKNGALLPNSKLTVKKVKVIKLLLGQGKTLKEIAGKFNISDMQVHRIKTGENWKYVK
ncbi:MAG: hypothetical protein JST17_13865 [Bacteroidetes bacterium]|nr:hypothetical protein [Bacteroidota bacterium]MBS1930898.1 hypothetical protein [Bacteroidota bacterium]